MKIRRYGLSSKWTQSGHSRAVSSKSGSSERYAQGNWHLFFHILGSCAHLFHHTTKALLMQQISHPMRNRVTMKVAWTIVTIFMSLLKHILVMRRGREKRRIITQCFAHLQIWLYLIENHWIRILGCFSKKLLAFPWTNLNLEPKEGPSLCRNWTKLEGGFHLQI